MMGLSQGKDDANGHSRDRRCGAGDRRVRAARKRRLFDFTKGALRG